MQLCSSGLGSTPSPCDEQGPCVRVGAQGVGLAAGVIEGEHQLSSEPFTERMLRHERLELRRRVARAGSQPSRRQRVLDAGDAHLLEPPRSRSRRTGAVTSASGSPRQSSSAVRSARALEQAPAPSHAAASTARNGRRPPPPARREPVTGRPGHEHLGPEYLSERGDRVLQRGRRRPRRLFAPEIVDRGSRRDGFVRRSNRREQRALLLPAERERLPILGDHLERPENPELGHRSF